MFLLAILTVDMFPPTDSAKKVVDMFPHTSGAKTENTMSVFKALLWIQDI